MYKNMICQIYWKWRELIKKKKKKKLEVERERERERCLFHTHRQTHDFIHTVALPREELIREGKIMIYHSRKS
jgi:hypothetical protein